VHEVSPCTSQSTDGTSGGSNTHHHHPKTPQLPNPPLPALARSPQRTSVPNLARTRACSQRDAVVALSLLPLTAAVNVSLILTFSGLVRLGALVD